MSSDMEGKMQSRYDSYDDMVKGITEENDQLRKDKERLDWIEQGDLSLIHQQSGEWFVHSHLWGASPSAKSPREAIDNSMPCDHTFPTDRFGGNCSKCDIGAPEDE